MGVAQAALIAAPDLSSLLKSEIPLHSLLFRISRILCVSCFKLFFAKVAFSGFLLGNREKIAVVANDDSSLFPAKMSG